MEQQTQSGDDASCLALAEEGRAVRAYIESNRSTTLLRLFDFLLEQSLKGNRPREIEIAEEVFNESWGATAIEGSHVRVCVHRLRKKLDHYYIDKPGDRLVLRKGEYSLVLKRSDDAEAEPATSTDSAEPGKRRSLAPWLALLGLVIANLTLGYILQNRAFSGTNRSPSPFWRSFGNGADTKIILGDYFMFLSTIDEYETEAPTQDLSIRNTSELYQAMGNAARSQDRIMDGNSYSVSIETVQSVGKLWPLIRHFRPDPISGSELDAEMMNSSNLIYVGALDALTPLIASPLFEASRYRCAQTCYELIDKTSDKRFLSASPYLLADNIIPRHDYGYIASFPGPSGKQILVISGTGEAGVSEMVRVAGDPSRLNELSQRIRGDFTAFEALFQVRTMFAQNYQSELLTVQKLDSEGMWDQTRPLEQ